MPTVDIANEDIAGAKIDFHLSAFPTGIVHERILVREDSWPVEFYSNTC